MFDANLKGLSVPFGVFFAFHSDTHSCKLNNESIDLNNIHNRGAKDCYLETYRLETQKRLYQLGSKHDMISTTRGRILDIHYKLRTQWTFDFYII